MDKVVLSSNRVAAAIPGISVPTWSARSDSPRFSNPTETVLFYEKGSQLLGQAGDSTGEDFFQMWGADQATMKQRHYPYPHGQGKVFAFVDSHAKYSQVGTGPFAYSFKMPNGTAYYPPGYCGDLNAGLYAITNNSDPGANLPQ